MSAKEIRAGRAFVEVSIRDKLAQGLRGAWAKLKAFAGMVKTAFLAVTGTLAAIGAAIAAVVAPVVSLSKHFAEAGSQLHDMAARTGVAVETLSAMKFAAEQTGASLSDVETALRMMAKKGIPVEKFDELAKSIAAIQDPSERAAAAMQVFGKSGTRLLPMLAEWTDLKARANQLGLIVTKDEAAAADDLGDRFDSLGAVWDRLKTKAGASFAPVMVRALDALTSLLVTLGRSLELVARTLDLVGTGMARVGAQANAMMGAIGAGMASLGLGGTKLNAAAGVMGAGTNSIFGGAKRLPPAMEQQYGNMIKKVRGGSSFGTFSSPGSSLAGRSGQGIKTDEVDKKILAVLQKIGITLDKKLGDIDEGIEDLDVGFQ